MNSALIYLFIYCRALRRMRTPRLQAGEPPSVERWTRSSPAPRAGQAVRRRIQVRGRARRRQRPTGREEVKQQPEGVHQVYLAVVVRVCGRLAVERSAAEKILENGEGVCDRDRAVAIRIAAHESRSS